MSKVTEWFPPELKPVRVGWYERDYGNHETNRFYDYFDGDSWYYGAGSNRPTAVMACASRPWRGLATRPSKRGK